MLDRWNVVLAVGISLAAMSACSSSDSDMRAGSNEQGRWCSVALTPNTISYEIIAEALKLEDDTGEFLLLHRVSETGGRPIYGRWRTESMFDGEVEQVVIFDFAEGSIAVSSVCKMGVETISPSVSGAAQYTDSTITVLDAKEDKQYFDP